MNQTQATTELSIMLSDTLQQISVDRLDAAVKSAWRDGYVSTPVWDKTTVFVSGTFEYTIPSTVTVVDSLYVEYSTSKAPEPISAELWEIVDGKIHFSNCVSSYINSGNTIVIRGKYKLSATDIVPDEYPTLHDYVITLAGWNILKHMGYTKALAFLNNDTSMTELIGFRREVERDLKALRTQLQTSYMDS